MHTQKPHPIKTSNYTADKDLNGAKETPAAFLQMNNAASEDQAQQLGSLTRIVRETLGLTLEEALQMAEDLGFQKC